MADALVRFEGVRKAYGGAASGYAVQRLDLSVEKGELLTLLGPSGSGKTTTLMMLAGFEQPTEGRILLEGRDIARLPAHKRGIGVVFQSYALFPHMTVAENLAFPLEVRGVPKAERAERVRRALAMVRLERFADRRPTQLSGGQQQRIALARAMVFEPPIVLLDEPLGALDKSLREEMQYEIRALHQRLGLTMMYVTHDQAEALTLSDRIAVFEGGLIRQLAPPRTIYERPANAFVAGFVGENNRLPGRVVAQEGGVLRVALECVVTVRPERVAVAPVAAEDLGEGALPAILREAIFQGDHVRLRLEMGQGGEVLAKRAVGGGSMPEPGAAAALRSALEVAAGPRTEVTLLSLLCTPSLNQTGPMPVGGAHFGRRLVEARFATAREAAASLATQMETFCQTQGYHFRMRHEEGDAGTLLGHAATHHDLTVLPRGTWFDHAQALEEGYAAQRSARVSLPGLLLAAPDLAMPGALHFLHEGDLASSEALKRFLGLSFLTHLPLTITGLDLDGAEAALDEAVALAAARERPVHRGPVLLHPDRPVPLPAFTGGALAIIPARSSSGRMAWRSLREMEASVLLA